ncbi:MAG TPA: Rpn family recombination-promoting nuclease/putative transposase [Candidatus Mediterraneibacter intestinigallinarum]|nr:Rpn family recombination-promoting nuclease/putative transposase [Candidatus Mediterraneibacter intestinigallinarum]
MKPEDDIREKGEQNDDNFIMLPTVDFCFKGLMNNPKVRKGFIAALLKKDPETIRETVLLPTVLGQEYQDDKLGILDVRVLMEDKTQIDMEMQVAYFDYWDARVLFYLSKIFAGQLKKGEPYENLKKCIHVSILDFIHFEKDTKCYRTICFCDEKTGKKYTDLMEMQVLELKKLPPDIRSGDDLIKWMKFFGGKSRKEFAAMAKTDSYIEEAYKELEKLSADERAKLEYEARERAIRDYNSQMSSALRRGEQKGMERGLKRGIQQGEHAALKHVIEKMTKKGKSREEIAELLDLDLSEITALALSGKATDKLSG